MLYGLMDVSLCVKALIVLHTENMWPLRVGTRGWVAEQHSSHREAYNQSIN